MFPFKRTIGAQRENVAEPPVKPNESGDPGDMYRELGQTIQGVLAEMSQIREQISGIEKNSHQPVEPTPVEPNQQISTLPKQLHEYSAEEMEELSPQDTAKIMSDGIKAEIGQTIKEELGPLMQKIDRIDSTTAQDRTKTEIERVQYEQDTEGKSLRPDFKEWLPEMAALQKETPGLSIMRLYNLVRNESPEKMVELKKRYWPEPETKDNVLTPPFGGLAPNLMNKTVDGGDLSLNDSGEKALKDVREAHGALPPSDQVG